RGRIQDLDFRTTASDWCDAVPEVRYLVSFRKDHSEWRVMMFDTVRRQGRPVIRRARPFNISGRSAGRDQPIVTGAIHCTRRKSDLNAVFKIQPFGVAAENQRCSVAQ